MQLLDRLLRHDLWTTTQLMNLCEDLEESAFDREFGFAYQSLRATFDHVIFNMQVWSDLMEGRPVRPRGGSSVPELQARLKQAGSDLSRVANQVRERDDWDTLWTDAIDGKKHSFGGAIAHVLTHSMHHRAQIIYMLRQLNVKNVPEGDVLSWETQTKK